MTYEQIRKDHAVQVYIAKADESLCALGYTEHSFPHVSRVAEQAAYILETLGYPARTVELSRIAGYLHDIGNVVNRVDHSQSGAVMAFQILNRMEFPAEEIAVIVSAIGNHDEGTGIPVDAVAAALIIADKSDVRRSRVRNPDDVRVDIHDRVNYSATHAQIVVDPERETLTICLSVDTSVSSPMEYLEIFMKRMLLCRSASQKLGLSFHLEINGQRLV